MLATVYLHDIQPTSVPNICKYPHFKDKLWPYCFNLSSLLCIDLRDYKKQPNFVKRKISFFQEGLECLSSGLLGPKQKGN
jgi:hypothetical protein